MTTRRPSPLRRKDGEHLTQKACVEWFNLSKPRLRGCLVAVPNGGRRDAKTGARLRDEGVVAGCADLLLLVPNKFYGCLCIEMKTEEGRQSAAQKAWQETIAKAGNKYVVCRSLGDFIFAVDAYLQDI